jgi:hypothetical protein
LQIFSYVIYRIVYTRSLGLFQKTERSCNFYAAINANSAFLKQRLIEFVGVKSLAMALAVAGARTAAKWMLIMPTPMEGKQNEVD